LTSGSQVWKAAMRSTSVAMVMISASTPRPGRAERAGVERQRDQAETGGGGIAGHHDADIAPDAPGDRAARLGHVAPCRLVGRHALAVHATNPSAGSFPVPLAPRHRISTAPFPRH
jgi:hypothetical protein